MSHSVAHPTLLVHVKSRSLVIAQKGLPRHIVVLDFNAFLPFPQ